MVRKLSLQSLLSCTTAVAAALLICVPNRFNSVRCTGFGLIFALLVQAAATVVQICTLRDTYRAYKKAVWDYRRCRPPKPKKKPGFHDLPFERQHTFALRKASGINPDRAGPAFAAA